MSKVNVKNARPEQLEFKKTININAIQGFVKLNWNCF